MVRLKSNCKQGGTKKERKGEMKKTTLFLLSFVITVSLFGCGNNPAPKESTKDEVTTGQASSEKNEEPTKLTLILRGGTYGDVIKKMLPEFEKENNVTCEVMDLAFADLHDKIALDARNPKGAYDLIMVDGSWIPEFIEYGVAMNLSEAGYSLDDDFIKEAAVAGYDKSGALYCVPHFGNVNIMLYNDALLESVGASIPETWAEVLETARKVQDSGKDGFLVRAQAGDNITSDFLAVLLAHGGKVLDENNQPTINTLEFKKALEMYIDLKNTGAIMDKDDIVAAISGEKAALSLSWPGWYVPETDGPAHYTVIPTKVDESAPSNPSSIYGIWFVGIAANSQNREMTLKLLEYVTNAENQLASVENGGVSTRHSVYQNKEVIDKYPHLEIIYNALQSGVYRPLVTEWNNITIALGNELDAAVQGAKTVDQALADAQYAVERIMK